MRGEEAAARCCAPAAVELPPHARRRARLPVIQPARARITSACAEKSLRLEHAFHCAGNYLRMRGEETALPAETLAVGVVL